MYHMWYLICIILYLYNYNELTKTCLAFHVLVHGMQFSHQQRETMNKKKVQTKWNSVRIRILHTDKTQTAKRFIFLAKYKPCEIKENKLIALFLQFSVSHFLPRSGNTTTYTSTWYHCCGKQFARTYFLAYICLQKYLSAADVAAAHAIPMEYFLRTENNSVPYVKWDSDFSSIFTPLVFVL